MSDFYEVEEGLVVSEDGEIIDAAPICRGLCPHHKDGCRLDAALRMAWGESEVRA